MQKKIIIVKIVIPLKSKWYKIIIMITDLAKETYYEKHYDYIIIINLLCRIENKY